MSTRHLDLAGHVAIVTGANHGIGAAIAKALAASGAGVLVTYLRVAATDGDDEGYARLRSPALRRR
jgi:3-oxoacyl-[acyl-carrier protein] reductase